jgi:phage recombination protein Bet
MTTETETQTIGALVLAADQTAWTGQQLTVLAAIGVGEQVTAQELALFLHECQRTGLDPFTRQIYLIGRYDKKAGREVYRSQTAIDGFRLVAHRAARRDGVTLAYADTLWCGPDGVWRDAWLWERPPLAAKVAVQRGGEPFPAVATLGEYAARYPSGDLYPMWARMPATMIAKCAEALALRKAFPHDLAGIYTAEEMGQADAHTVTVEQIGAGPEATELQAEVQPHPVTEQQRRDIAGLLRDRVGLSDPAECLRVISGLAGRDVASSSELTWDEAERVGWALAAEQAEPVAA